MEKKIEKKMETIGMIGILLGFYRDLLGLWWVLGSTVEGYHPLQRLGVRQRQGSGSGPERGWLLDVAVQARSN